MLGCGEKWGEMWDSVWGERGEVCWGEVRGDVGRMYGVSVGVGERRHMGECMR